MVTLNWDWVNGEQLSIGKVLWILGIVTSAFSVGVGLLVMYVIPSSCSWLTSLELGILGLLFIAGLATLVTGKLMMRKGK